MSTIRRAVCGGTSAAGRSSSDGPRGFRIRFSRVYNPTGIELFYDECRWRRRSFPEIDKTVSEPIADDAVPDRSALKSILDTIVERERSAVDTRDVMEMTKKTSLLVVSYEQYGRRSRPERRTGSGGPERLTEASNSGRGVGPTVRRRFVSVIIVPFGTNVVSVVVLLTFSAQRERERERSGIVNSRPFRPRTRILPELFHCVFDFLLIVFSAPLLVLLAAAKGFLPVCRSVR